MHALHFKNIKNNSKEIWALLDISFFDLVNIFFSIYKRIEMYR